MPVQNPIWFYINMLCVPCLKWFACSSCEGCSGSKFWFCLCDPKMKIGVLKLWLVWSMSQLFDMTQASYMETFWVCHSHFTLIVCLKNWSDKEVCTVIWFLWAEDCSHWNPPWSGKSVQTTSNKYLQCFKMVFEVWNRTLQSDEKHSGRQCPL